MGLQHCLSKSPTSRNPLPQILLSRNVQGIGDLTEFLKPGSPSPLLLLTFINISFVTSLFSFSPSLLLPMCIHPSAHVPRQQSQQTMTCAGALVFAAGRDCSSLQAKTFPMLCSSTIIIEAWKKTPQDNTKRFALSPRYCAVLKRKVSGCLVAPVGEERHSTQRVKPYWGKISWGTS